MPRNNKDFHGVNGLIHFSHKDNRASIENSGLKAGNPTGADPVEGVDLSGVYAYNSPQIAHEEEFENTGGATPNMDIWAIHPDWRRSWDDDPHMMGVASYTQDDIQHHELKRVGHTTESGEIHWHPEEFCRYPD